MITLLTGGIKSGKSTMALDIAQKEFIQKRFLATAQASDPEMAEKIRLHQLERGKDFVTYEEPIEIQHYFQDDTILDCITLWVANLFDQNIEDQGLDRIDRFIAQLPTRGIIVTNETGLGNIGFESLTRKYNNLLGLVNQRLARASDRVVFMVSGIPMIVKGEPL